MFFYCSNPFHKDEQARVDQNCWRFWGQVVLCLSLFCQFNVYCNIETIKLILVHLPYKIILRWPQIWESNFYAYIETYRHFIFKQKCVPGFVTPSSLVDVLRILLSVFNLHANVENPYRSFTRTIVTSESVSQILCRQIHLRQYQAYNR